MQLILVYNIKSLSDAEITHGGFNANQRISIIRNMTPNSGQSDLTQTPLKWRYTMASSGGR